MPKTVPNKEKGPKDFEARLRKMRIKQSRNPDRKDYQRTIAGRGDTHALDGGKTLPQSPGRKLAAILPVWEDRNSSNQGTKLNP